MTSVVESVPVRTHVGVGALIWRFVKRHALTVYAALIVGYLMLPIAVVILFSFNHPTGRFNYVWNSFTFENWIHWNGPLGIQGAIQTSLEVAALATTVATILGTLIALAIVRHRFHGRSTTNLV